jgi:hypothetical protein
VIPVSAKDVLLGIIDKTRYNRVKVHVEHESTEIGFIFNVFRLVSALPKSACSTMALVESPTEQILNPVHSAPQRHGRRSDYQVIVIGHDTPGQDRPTVTRFGLADDFDELDGFFRVGEYRLATRNPVVHVVQTALDLDSRPSNHRCFPVSES